MINDIINLDETKIKYKSNNIELASVNLNNK
jgi:hypothetical protein